jgi:hypothetical protein
MQVIEAFRAASQFLDRRSTETLAQLRVNVLSLRLFAGVRMDHDQIELELPPEPLTACGRHALGIYVISNDITAAEAVAAGIAKP